MAQDEIRRLMKQAKTKPRTPTARPKTSSSIIANPAALRSVASHAQPQKPMLPAGFFDNAVADAKARNVDIQELSKKQVESEWAAFQEFAEEVEKQSVIEDKVHVEETKEREAIEQLENMEYVERYRRALERVTSVRKGEKRTSENVVEEDSEEEGSRAALMVLNEYKKKQKKRRKQAGGDDLDDLEPWNWRCRGI